jgi:hypothetical protein
MRVNFCQSVDVQVQGETHLTIDDITAALQERIEEVEAHRGAGCNHRQKRFAVHRFANDVCQALSAIDDHMIAQASPAARQLVSDTLAEQSRRWLPK